jgi:hypothetical protein
MEIVGYIKTKAHKVLFRPRETTTLERGIKRRVGGTRYTRKIPIPARSPQRPVNLAKLYAAGSANTRVIITTKTPMKREFLRKIV